MGRKEEIQRVIEDMKKDGIPLNEWTYNTLISTHGLSLAEVWELFDEIEGENFSPNVVNYSNLINQCGLNNELEMIEKLLLEMETKGIEMNAKSHKSVTEAYHRCGRTDLSVDYILQLERERGVLLKDAVKVLLVHFKSDSLRSSIPHLL